MSQGLELRKDLQFGVPSDAKLMVYEETKNSDRTFHEREICTPAGDDLLTILSLSPEGSVIAKYTTRASFPGKTECPNGAKGKVTAQQAKKWLDSYAEKAERRFDSELQAMMSEARKARLERLEREE